MKAGKWREGTEGLRNQAKEPKLGAPCNWKVSERDVLGLLSWQMVSSLGN